MNYYKNLSLRLVISLAILIFYKIFYFVFIPLTLYLSYFSLKLFYNPVLIDNSIFIKGNELVFVEACAALSAYLLLALLILLTKNINLKKSLKIFFVGSLLILAMNLIRIDVLIIVLIEKGVNYFETLHLFFWKILSSVYVALVWIFMTYKFKVKEIPVVDDFKTLKKKIR
ncbi:MAG TPA: pacearchaeosortase [Candidatus Nanoarchaeia archaeon]|nr:pacearchaeosortase [Candidatus Nanoarchaeia archaeon]